MIDRGLAFVGSFIPLHLDDPDRFALDLDWLAGHLGFMTDASPAGSRPLMVLAADFDNQLRFRWAGRIPEHPEAQLSETALGTIVDNLHRAAELCTVGRLRGRGPPPCGHGHRGSRRDPRGARPVGPVDPRLLPRHGSRPVRRVRPVRAGARLRRPAAACPPEGLRHPGHRPRSRAGRGSRRDAQEWRVLRVRHGRRGHPGYRRRASGRWLRRLDRRRAGPVPVERRLDRERHRRPAAKPRLPPSPGSRPATRCVSSTIRTPRCTCRPSCRSGSPARPAGTGSSSARSTSAATWPRASTCASLWTALAGLGPVNLGALADVELAARRPRRDAPRGDGADGARGRDRRLVRPAADGPGPDRPARHRSR